MLPLIADIQSFFRLPNAKIGDAQLTGPAHAANATLRELVGASLMNEADANAPVITETLTQSRLEILKMAGNYLAMWHAAPAIGLRVRTDGLVTVETSESARTLRYATAEEVEQYRAMLFNQAMQGLSAITGLLLVADDANGGYASGQRTITDRLPVPVAVGVR
jgi:hypothetical protein